MSNLSLNEINGCMDTPFKVDSILLLDNERKHKHYFKSELLKIIHKGFYPQLYNQNTNTNNFYTNYIDSYINEEVRKLIKVKDLLKFTDFLKLIAFYNDQEFVKTNLSKDLQIDIRTIDSWINILVGNGIISIVPPYFDISITKRIVKKYKIYFNDTGLLCHLLNIKTVKDLCKSKHLESIYKTFVFNEINKSYLNNLDYSKIYFYRDKNQNSVDFVIIKDGKLNLLEVKIDESYSKNDIKNFNIFYESNYEIEGKCIICLTDNSYAIKNNLFSFPHQVI